VIDVHAHVVPDAYREAVAASDHHGEVDGFGPLPAWTAAEHVAAMDRLGIATSLLVAVGPAARLRRSRSGGGPGG